MKKPVKKPVKKPANSLLILSQSAFSDQIFLIECVEMFTPVLLSISNASDLTETAPISQVSLHMAAYLPLHK